MIDVLTAEDVRRQDADAEARGIPVETLMDNAGWAVARAARAMMGGCYGRRVVVACGKGNNGGDGLVAGRILHAQGAKVTAILLAPPESLSALNATNLGRFRGRVAHIDGLSLELGRSDLVIDAIFGVGLSRAPEGVAAEAIREIAHAGVPVLAVDVPSGVNADTGSIQEDPPARGEGPFLAVRAARTVTFGGLKPGLLFEPGRAFAGEVEVADIGTLKGGASARALEAANVARALPARLGSGHKRGSGVTLIVAGSRAMPGAAVLATAACVRAGSGLTTILSTEEVCAIVQARVPEATAIPVPASSEGILDMKALEAARARLEGYDAAVVGPGLSTHPATVEFVRALVASTSMPMVLDADGLNAFAGSAGALATRDGALYLTPHAGEAARLLGMPAPEVDRDRLETARRLCEAIEGDRALFRVAVLKGPGTVVRRGKTVYVNTTGGPALAQGGTGDVLAGLLGALVAQDAAIWRRRVDGGGRDRPQANPQLAAAAAWVHGRAADRIAARAWPQPAHATALIEELGPTMHDVLNV
jgi:NAD(P)H-hydrate epimerase